jgi:hypothetical protein
VVPVEEVPEGIGLLEAVGDGTRLVSRRKASRREIELPSKLLVYILMARVVPGKDREMRTYDEIGKEARRAELKRWAESKDERRAMSYLVSQKIQEQFDRQEHALRKAQEQAEALKYVRDRMVELGFNPESSSARCQVTNKLQEMAGALSGGLGPMLERTIAQLQRAHDEVQAITSRARVSA